MKKPTVGFVGQGYVGKNYADNFERRGFEVVRYSVEEKYKGNKEKIKECDIVFIAVPTPTTPKGFDQSIVESVLKLVGEGKIAVIKSTIAPGTAKKLQAKFPKIILLMSPEFLSEATAARDAAHPFSNILGVAVFDARHKRAAEKVLSLLPKARFSLICDATEAEIIKYVHNINGYSQIVMFNLMYDLARGLGASWDNIQKAIEADPFIPSRYSKPVHKSGRGAGGACFIKDFAAFKEAYKKNVKDKIGLSLLTEMENKNNDLLLKSKKDLYLLAGVYGKNILKKKSAE